MLWFGLMQFQNLLTYLSYPIKAIVSRNFYFEVMLKMKGVGLVYLLVLCTVLALPATTQVKEVLLKFKSLELSTVVAQIPASNISPQGVLSPVNPSDSKPFFIYNSHKEIVMAYNLENVPMEGGVAPITITSHAALIQTHDGGINVPWSSIYGNSGAQFEPLQAAQMLEQAFNASFFTIWMVVILWIFSTLAFVVLIAACLTKVLCLFISKMKVSFTLALRLNAYGSTVIAAFIVAQFFVNISLSYIVMCLVPAIYSLSFLALVRRTLNRAVDDPKFALSSNNPFVAWFERQSRTDENGNLDTGPSFEDLSPEDQERRLANLKRNINKGMDFSSYQNQYYQQHPIYGAARAAQQRRTQEDKPNNSEILNQPDNKSEGDKLECPPQSQEPKNNSQDSSFIP